MRSHDLQAEGHAIGVFEKGDGYTRNTYQVGKYSIDISQEHFHRIMAHFAKFEGR